jgi:SAM-dependent methyltransferase
MDVIKTQFGRPSGFLGHLAGKIMASRESNVERSRWTVSLLELRPNSRVLEIGFGPGIAVEEVSRVAIAGLAAGIDHSEVMLRQASRRNADVIREGRVDLRLASVTDLPDYGERFDAILAVNSMMFWDDPVECLKALRERLKPGGRIAITHQPRGANASDEAAVQRGKEIAAALLVAGFEEVRVKIRSMKPVNVVCVLGFAP